MATLLEYPTCPRRVGASLYCDAHGLLGGEASSEGKASGVVRSLPSSITSPLSESRRQRGRSSCRLCPIRLSYLDALCYHPRWPILLPYWASEPVEDLQTQRVLRMGVRPSHLIFRESPLQAVRFINRTPKTSQAQRQQIVAQPKLDNTAQLPGLRTLEVPSARPERSLARTATYGSEVRTTIAVSNPFRGTSPRAFSRPWRRPASTAQVATSVAPFQLT